MATRRIIVSATQANPYPPDLTDAENTTNTTNGDENKDINFTVAVDPDDDIVFEAQGVIGEITAITPSTDNSFPIFNGDPAPTDASKKTWKAKAAAAPDGDNTTGSYSISYKVEFTRTQDPKIKINKKINK